MKQAKSGRQSRRSRRLIVDALLALMQEKRFDRITVQDIVDRADVGRSTFYAQFRSRDDVLESEMAQIFDSMQSGHVEPADSLADQLLPSLALFRHVQETQPRYPALFRRLAADQHRCVVHRLLRDRAAHRLSGASGARDVAVPPDVVADYLAGAFLTLVRWWIDGGLRDTPEQMEAMYRRLVMPGVRSVLPDHGG